MSDAEPDLLSERIGAVLRLTINRPHAANAINDRVARGLVEELRATRADDGVRAVVLTAAGGRVFSAGRDLKNPENLPADVFEAQRRAEVRAYNEALLDFDKPLVAALNGTALGAGVMLVMHADQVIAVEHAEMALPETGIGIVSYLAHTLVAVNGGHALANDLILTGRRLSSPEARARGLVHAVVPAERLAEEALARATLLAEKPPETFRAIKQWILARRRAAVEVAFAAHDERDALG